MADTNPNVNPNVNPNPDPNANRNPNQNPNPNFTTGPQPGQPTGQPYGQGTGQPTGQPYGPGAGQPTGQPGQEDYSEYLKNMQAGAMAAGKTVANTTRHAADMLAEKMNTMAGGEGKVDLRFKDFFVNVFKKHTQDEADEIFICGTKTTTPALQNISTQWPRPWLYSRVAVVMFATFFILLLCLQLFGYSAFNVLPGTIIFGSFTVPVTVLVFFFEVNVPRNISFSSVLTSFFIGGSSSLIITFILVTVFPGGENFFGAIMTGVLEEIAKLVIVAILIQRKPGNNYILNGMLYGAAVGAGFAAFESAGYALGVIFETGSMDYMLHNIYGRGFLAPGGHVAWAAIAGAAIMIAKDKKPFQWEVLLSPKFWAIFIWPVAMHSVWDMPISLGSIASLPVHMLILIAIAWIMVVVMLNRGLSEINRMTSQVG